MFSIVYVEWEGLFVDFDSHFFVSLLKLLFLWLQLVQMGWSGFLSWMILPAKASSMMSYSFWNVLSSWSFFTVWKWDIRFVHNFYLLHLLCRFLRINLPAAGSHPTAIAFSEGASSLVVAAQNLTGASLYMYEESTEKATSETKHQPKLPLPEIKWEHHKVHETRAIITLVGTSATYGSADGSAVIVSCSEGMTW